MLLVIEVKQVGQTKINKLMIGDHDRILADIEELINLESYIPADKPEEENNE